MFRILILLQNAYDKGDLAAGWNPSRWRKELKTSRSMTRVLQAIPSAPGYDLYFANACPGMGVGSRSKLIPCRKHLRRVIRRVEPAAILACGRIAEALAEEVWAGSIFAIPHPACRVVHNDLLLRCRQEIDAWYRSAARHDHPRIAFRLEKGKPGGQRLVITTTKRESCFL